MVRKMYCADFWLGYSCRGKRKGMSPTVIARECANLLPSRGRLRGCSVALVLILCMKAATALAQQATPADPTSVDPVPPAPQASVFEGNPAGEPLDDPNFSIPGHIEPDLDIIERDPSNWLGIPPDKEWLNYIRDPLQKLDERYGVLLTGAYTALFQQSIGPDATAAAAGDFDLTVRWTPIGRGTPNTGSFYFTAENRHTLGALEAPSTLGDTIGTLLGTTNGFSDRGWAVKDAYYAQRLFDDRLRVGLGRVDSENLVGNHLLQSANTSFLNQAFSKNVTIAFPGSGAGVAASLRPVKWFYLSGGATNAYGNTTTFTYKELDEWRFFEFVEIGYTPTIENVGESRYRVSIWHMDERERTDQPSDQGFSLIWDQTIGERITLFARYGYADGDALDVHQSAQAGGAITGLFGSAADLTGLAVGWSNPTQNDLRDEKVVEAFHRLQLTGRVQLTLDMQLILDPSHRPETDALGVFSARLRVSF